MKTWLPILLIALLPIATAHAEEFSLAAAETAWQRGDAQTARAHWEELSSRGDLIATNNLGHLYENGITVEQDFAKSLDLYLRAANGGFAVGQFNVAEAYAKGRGVTVDSVEAMKWYMLAAAAGDKDASAAAHFMQPSLTHEQLAEASLRMMQWRRDFVARKKKSAPTPEQPAQ